MESSIKWILKKFDELTVDELYNILRLRNEVFVVEQNCVYQDLDDKDKEAWHLMGIQKRNLVAYTRLFPPGTSYSNPSIGRVVTAASVRRTGLGKELMNQSIHFSYELFGKKDITLGAQLYLKKFYESLGFITSGEEYLEDGIPHITMTRKATA